MNTDPVAINAVRFLTDLPLEIDPSGEAGEWQAHLFAAGYQAYYEGDDEPAKEAYFYSRGWKFAQREYLSTLEQEISDEHTR
jgi:hypothetical protein